jgi:hypothetical protein
MTGHGDIRRRRVARSTGRRQDQGVADSTGGWVRWATAKISPEERARRRAEAEQAQAEHLQWLQREHRAVFGGVNGPISISQVTMPLSGGSFWWRSDGYLATMSAGELAVLAAGRLDAEPPGPDQRIRWQGPEAGIRTEGEADPGYCAEPTWWLVWGEVYPGDMVSCWLADNSDVPVTRLGCIWIAEYSSCPQTFFYAVNGKVDDVPVHGAAFLPPPAHSFTRSAPNPRA